MPEVEAKVEGGGTGADDHGRKGVWPCVRSGGLDPIVNGCVHVVYYPRFDGKLNVDKQRRTKDVGELRARPGGEHLLTLGRMVPLNLRNRFGQGRIPRDGDVVIS